MQQQPLELGPLIVPPHVEGDSIQQRFERFHEANPHVYRALVGMARDLKHRGRSRIGIGMLYEVLRWHYAMATGGSDFKLNNNYRSRYARLIEAQEADLAGVFEKRELLAA